jgi:transposase
VVIDEKDEVVYRKRLPNDLAMIVSSSFQPIKQRLRVIVVESTYNWYWLVDGLMERWHRVYLANTAAVQQYNGRKYTDDDSDARWLAHLLRWEYYPRVIFIRENNGRCAIYCASGAS